MRSPRRADRGHLIVLLFIDIDRFKDINDTHGHAAGDEVLRQVASRLSSACARVDAIARQGGGRVHRAFERHRKERPGHAGDDRMQESSRSR
jgi:diguanylate cyclase (GGDEF)-like protein